MATYLDTILATIRAAAVIAEQSFHPDLVDWEESSEMPDGDRNVVLRVVSEIDEDPAPVKITTLGDDGKITTCLAQRSLVSVDVRIETIHATELPHLAFARGLKGALATLEVQSLMETSDPPIVLVQEPGQIFNRSKDGGGGVMLPQSSFELRFRAQTLAMTDPTTVPNIDSVTAEGSTADGNPTPFESTVTVTRP